MPSFLRSPGRTPCAVVVIAASAACSRSTLSIDASGAHEGGAAPFAGTGGSGASAGSGGPDGGVETGGGGAGGSPPERCFLDSAGPGIVGIAYPEGNADSPGLVAIDPGAPEGAPGGPRPARVAHSAISMDANFWHPELRVAALRVGAEWPDVVVEQPPKLFGIDAHAWGELAPGATAGGLALVWFRGDEAAGKPSGLKLRTVDTATWGASDEVFIDPTGTVAYGVAPGPGVDAQGGWAGAGYALAWRGEIEGGTSEPRIALVDAAGAITAGPFASAAPRPYPGLWADVLWTGSGYLVATPFEDCQPGEPLCVPYSTVIARIRPPSPGDPGGLEAVASVPVAKPGATPRKPSLARSDATGIWMAWAERDEPDDVSPRDVRIVRLAATGALAGEPRAIAAGVYTATPVALTAAELGLVVTWGEPGDPDVEPGDVGAARVVFHHLDASGDAAEAPVTIQTSAFGYAASPSAVVLAAPRSVLIGWASRADGGGPTVTRLARFDCKPEPVP